MSDNKKLSQGSVYNPIMRGSEEMRIKRLINRLCEWLKAQGFTAEKIVECIKYITT
jgi:hypothetical protein